MSGYINTLAQYRMSDDWAGHRARGSRGGIDYAVGMNTPILAPCDGRLENRPMTNGFGNYIRFHHGDGFIDEYLHLRDGGFVAEGNYSQGQIIGYSGSTGDSTGPHVHWHLIDPSGTRVNPLDYVGGSAPAPAPAATGNNVVQPGDGYWHIAERVWGGDTATINANMKKLIELNGNKRLYAGNTVILEAAPPAPTPAPEPAKPVAPPVQQHENPKPPAKPATKPVTKPVSKPVVKPAEPAKPSKPLRPVKIKDVQPVFAAIPTQKGVIVRGGLFGVVRSLTFWNDTLTRAFNTFLQVALAAVGTGAVGITDIDYIGILNLAAGGAIVSVLTSFVRATTPKK